MTIAQQPARLATILDFAVAHLARPAHYDGVHDTRQHALNGPEHRPADGAGHEPDDVRVQAAARALRAGGHAHPCAEAERERHDQARCVQQE